MRRTPDPADARKDFYSLTDKGLDFIPVIFEMLLWSAKYDSKSEARRITKLISKIRKNNRLISKEIIERLREGQPLFPKYLDAGDA